jgi:hypothetical protein
MFIKLYFKIFILILNVDNFLFQELPPPYKEAENKKND